MHVHFQLSELPEFNNAVITIGAFDGVHTGHVAILERVKEAAIMVQGESVVITFHPHPRRILDNAKAPSLLTSLEERILRFQQLSLNHLVVVPFDPQFSELEAEAYVHEFLYRYFKPKKIVIGYDHRFGKDRAGDFSLLKKMGNTLGFDVEEIPEKVLNQSKISSTQIRTYLLNGNIKEANQLLSYVYSISGTVMEGDKLGRTLGFPTANLHIQDSDKLIPASGVYAVVVDHYSQDVLNRYQGMMNIGYRPTVNGKERRIEVHIFNFDQTIYGDTLTIYLIANTRKEIKFTNLEALKDQLKKDKTEIAHLLSFENITSVQSLKPSL